MPQYNLDIPCIGNSSPYKGSEEEQLRMKENENLKKRIGKDNFKSYFGNSITNNSKNFIKNYVSADPSPPPLLHKFREESKDTFLFGPLKF